MSVGISCLFLLVFVLIVLAGALLITSHQRRLKEKKMQFVNCKKQRDFHHSRFQSHQKEIERLRLDYNNKLTDLSFLSQEISNSKQVITEILDILQEETSALREQTGHDSTKITDRRKEMIKKYWQEFNGKKAGYLEKLKQARSDQVSLERLKAQKDDEFKKCNQLQSRLENLKSEYLRLARNPILPFKTEKHSS